MGKVSYLFKRICNMNFNGLFNTVNLVHQKNNKSKIVIFFDIVYCGLKYQAGYVDYNLFEMYKMNGKERKTVVTRGINNNIIKKYNDKNYINIFEDKTLFNQKFDKFLNREWLYLNDNYDEFKKFLKNKKEIIVKPVDLSCGKGIEKIDVTNCNSKEIYNKLVTNKQLLIEEVAIQNDKINAIYETSINTIRVVTLNHHVVFAFIRIGANGNIVDNFNHGGLVCKVDIENGKIITDGMDKQGKIYLNHPNTNTKLKGTKLPLWNEVIKLCEEASYIVPEVGYVGWDVCIGNDKPFLIEGNDFPGHDIYQLPQHRTSNYGDLPILEKAMQSKDL